MFNLAIVSPVRFLLGGKDDTGKPVSNTVGIYGLLEVEKQAQDQARFEKEYLEPIWASAISQAEAFRSRRAGLEVELGRLRRAAGR